MVYTEKDKEVVGYLNSNYMTLIEYWILRLLAG